MWHYDISGNNAIIVDQNGFTVLYLGIREGMDTKEFEENVKNVVKNHNETLAK